MVTSSTARAKGTADDGPKSERRFWLERSLAELAGEEADRRWQGGLQRQKSGAQRQRSESAVYRDAVRFFLAGRVAEGTLGEQLQQARKEAGLTVSELSRRTAETGKGLAPSVIWRIENAADKSPRPRSLQTLAAALDVSIVIDPDGVAVLRRNT